MNWRKEAGISQLRLATLSNVSHMTVIRNEQALYPDPSARIIQALIDLRVGPFYSPQPWEEYERIYHEYQMRVRSHTNWESAPFSSGLLTDNHPFLLWREALGFPTRLAFCKAACVSSPQVLNYETARQRVMPKSIKAALSPFVAISKLDVLGRRYYDMVNKELAHAVNE